MVHVPWMDPEDVQSLLWRRHAYNNALMSMRKLWKAETAAHDAARLGIGGLRNREEEELNARMRDNERENARLAEARCVSPLDSRRRAIARSLTCLAGRVASNGTRRICTTRRCRTSRTP